MPKKIVKKTWGYEIWFANVDDPDVGYCGKEIFVKGGEWSSKGLYHHHEKKDETFYIIEGYLELDYVTLLNDFRKIILGPNDSFRIKPLIKHRFAGCFQTDCKFIEASTTHYDYDSYRSEWDEKRKVWVAKK
jgi:mannose-6-phosphate isomerase-like protein (cupin superfamily)